MRMKSWIAAAFALLACGAGIAQPGGAAPVPLVLIVGGPAGNPGDLLLRTLSAPLAAELGQPVVVENKPGAAGTIALAAVARGRPDGNVLALLALQSAAAPALIKSIPYDTLRDLAPVRQLSWVSNVLVVAPDSPFDSLKDVMAAGRSQALTVASGGNGTPAHLAAELFGQQAQVPLRLVPFNGAPAGVNAVLAGHVQMMFAAVPAVAGLVQAGKLRALAGAGPQRSPLMPAVPTLVESGMPGASMRDWHGLVAPAGTPPERVERIARALDKVLAVAAVRQSLLAAGLEPVAHSTPEEFKAFVAQEVGRWGEIVRRAGITLQ
jgi:tripartite-type tricarboxylate transporter receptor subunit TctC